MFKMYTILDPREEKIIEDYEKKRELDEEWYYFGEEEEEPDENDEYDRMCELRYYDETGEL